MNRSEKGATMSEYAVGISLLLSVFIAASVYISSAVSTRVEIGAEAEENFVPCSDGVNGVGAGELSGSECF